MSSHIDCITPEAFDSTEVLATLREPAIKRPIEFAEFPGAASLHGIGAMRGNLALSGAIDCLRDDLIALYIAAEEIHWHLRVKSYELQSWPPSLDQAEVARQLSGNILRVIVRCVAIKETVVGQDDCDGLYKAVLALQAENDALAPPPPGKLK